MRVDEFDFELPDKAIAQRPAAPRDAARLLEMTERALVDRAVVDLPSILRPGDLMVFNDTRVIPTRLMGRRGDARIEATLHKQIEPRRWRAFARPGRRLKPGQRIDFAPGFCAEVESKGEDGEVTLAFDRGGLELMTALETHGVMPLPPYIKRARGSDERDLFDYQTVYAKRPGAVAAPTAGLHFTERLLAALDARGVRRVSVTLHVGAGTFVPVKTELVEDHALHAEWGEIDDAAAAAVNRAVGDGGRVVAVGTTSLRLLEAAAGEDGHVKPFTGETDIFITPGYRFQVVDVLVTNFHLPRSTLFMLVCAFAGTERMKQAYRHAVDGGYRFYSYGDCCLLHRSASG
jgi:S-adenosylmethionine:tRNA ribosyltransferase-isomerase